MIPYVFRKQIKLFCLFFACCFLILTIFLFFLQIINGNHYRQQAQKLQIRTLTQQAARGKITDRYGTVLADNKTIYQVLFFPSEADRAQWNNSLVSALMLMRSVNVPCTVSFPIEKQGQRYCFSQDADAVSRLLETCKLPSDATAFEALQVLMKKYDAQQIPEEISLSLLAVRYQLNLQSYRSYLPLCLGESEDFTLCARISEFAPAGIHIQPRYLRHYPYQSTLCHTLGYIGKISGEQAENYLQNGYDLSSDLIGKSGIEQMMEPYLRAKKGQKQLSVNSRGLSTSSSALAEAQDGETVVLTIDLALQQAAEAALNETMAKIRSGAMGDAFPNAQIGAAVCLDVHSGEVLALASAPGFDPNVFTKALSNTQWQALSPSYLTASGQIDSDPTLPRPLVNNAVCAAFPPGSVFKPITAAAALGHNNRGIAGKIRHDQAGLGFFQHGAAGHADDQVVTVCAAHPLGAAILAVGRGVLALVAEVHQGGQVVVGHKDDVAAAPAVAAVRAASRDKLFAVEADRAIAALAGVQPDGCDINKITGTGHVLPPLGGVANTKNKE